MNGLGWDGLGQNAATLLWHVEGQTGGLRADERAVLIRSMQAWGNAAADESVVLLRAGRYNEPQTINKPVTLAATRGAVTIGAR